MAISNKFFNFNKYPHLGGLKGKSVGETLPNFRSWTVYDTCYYTTPITVYTGYFDPLDVGTDVYSDEALTIAASSPFYKDSNKFTLGGGAEIITKAPCFNLWNLLNACNGSPINVYTAFADSSLAINTVLYSDELLTNNYSQGQSYLADTSGTYGYRYYLTYSTTTFISNIIGCPIGVNLYTDCSMSSYITYYIPFNQMGAFDATINNGAKVFTDTDFTSEFNDGGTFVYNGYFYSYSRTTGTLQLNSCST